MNEFEFTRRGYHELLLTAIGAGYRFLSFDEAARVADGPVCLLRHDIDADLEAAAHMARQEAALGVRATYFLMLRSPIYNLFAHRNQRFAEELIGHGHWIGLHYDEHLPASRRASLDELVRREAAVLESLLGVRVGAVSFHQPGPPILDGRVRLEDFVNTYDRSHLPGFAYLSDSNRSWRTERPHRVFAERLHDKLQLLIHPMWWHTDVPGETTMEGWDRTLLSNWHGAQEQLLATERAYGNARTFSILPAADARQRRDAA